MELLLLALRVGVKHVCHNGKRTPTEGTNYLHFCTVHFEDSLSITHQRMHNLYIIY